MKAWSKTMGVLALSSGESELAAVARAPTEGLELQSILSDIDLCGHVAIKSDDTAAIGMVHRLGIGKVRRLAVGDLWVQHLVRSGTIRVSKMREMHKQSTLDQNYCCAIRKRAIGYLSMDGCNRSQKSDVKARFADDKV